jgi:signal transduction histidine kinase
MLLDTSRSTAIELKRAPCDLSRLVAEVVSSYQEQVPAAKEQVQLALQPAVSGQWDALRIEQVVLNLLTNAVKYGAGKSIRISVESDDKDALFVIADSGIGISRETHERIFERFERAVPIASYGGLGLGLYIARQIILAHGGSIEVESEPNKGARFSVRIPLVPPDGQP